MPARIRHTDDEIDELILGYAAQGPVSNALVRERSGRDRQAALTALQRLVERGHLVRLGERRGTRYELVE